MRTNIMLTIATTDPKTSPEDVANLVREQLAQAGSPVATRGVATVQVTAAPIVDELAEALTFALIELHPDGWRFAKAVEVLDRFGSNWRDGVDAERRKRGEDWIRTIREARGK